jgi:hypothetical protein
LIVLFFLPGWALVRALGLDRLLRGNRILRIIFLT